MPSPVSEGFASLRAWILRRGVGNVARETGVSPEEIRDLLMKPEPQLPEPYMAPATNDPMPTEQRAALRTVLVRVDDDYLVSTIAADIAGDAPLHRDARLLYAAEAWRRFPDGITTDRVWLHAPLVAERVSRDALLGYGA